MANLRSAQAAARLLVLGALTTLLTLTLTLAPNTADAAVAPGTGGRVEQEPTSAELTAQQAQIDQLRAEEKTQAAGVQDTRRALRATAALAGQALEDYSLAVHTLQARQLTERNTATTLQLAQQQLDVSRRDLGGWARQAYEGGSALALSPTLNWMFQAQDSDDVGTDVSVLRRVGDSRARALNAVQLARARADSAADTAAGASQVAAAAAIAATDAKNTADQAVAEQRRRLGIAESTLAQTQTRSVAAAARQADLRAAARAATAAEAGPGTGRGNQVTGQVGSCTGGDDVAQYPNGQIPLSALCPIWAAGGHYLRADAAYSYDQLSHAYATRFGQPICVTDSYRSYAEQVDLFARKPTLAAHPGTSNHGWGTAVDLCGGIQSFGTPTHDWMLLNAPLYGWFHPAWAEPGGSRPEPWHWEFGG